MMSCPSRIPYHQLAHSEIVKLYPPKAKTSASQQMDGKSARLASRHLLRHCLLRFVYLWPMARRAREHGRQARPKS